MKHVLLITSPREPGWLEARSEVAQGIFDFAEEVSDANVTLSATTLDRLEFTITNENQSIFDNHTQKSLEEYDAVHLRSFYKSTQVLDFANAVALFLQAKGIDLVDPVDRGLSIGKLSQMMSFALNGVSIPYTVASWDYGTLKKLIRSDIKYPVIVKANNAMKGSDNYKIDSDEELEGLLGHDRDSLSYIAQEFIPNDGDYRVLYLGSDQLPLIFIRKSIGDSHLNNTSKGGTSEKIAAGDFSKVALSVADQVHRESGRTVSGVDLMQNKLTGEWVALEINTSPALSMGAFHDEKVALYRGLLLNQDKE